MADLQVGLGIDLHAPGPGRVLLLGGVRFDDEAGLAGHSDGDVVCHALADALLGAAGLGDLGTDPTFEGIGGLDILGRVVSLLRSRGLAAVSCDLTLLAQRPHIAERRDEIRRNLAGALRVPVDRVSVKATRPEGLGLTGEGAGCMAVATIGPAADR